MIDSVFRTGKNYYLQVFLEECKYPVKEKKTPKYIIDNTEFFFDSDRENSYEENSDKETFDEEASDEIVNNYYKKKQRKASKRSTRKVLKSF